MDDLNVKVRVIESLRSGIPPKQGVTLYSVGHEKLIEGIKRFHLKGLGDQGIIRFISGSWGAGKTHVFCLLREAAFDDNCLVSNVELSANDTTLNKFERVFYAIIRNVSTPSASAYGDAMPFGQVLREALTFLSERSRSVNMEVSHEVFTKASETLMSDPRIDIDFKKAIRKYWETFLAEAGEPIIQQQIRGELLQWFSGEGTIGTFRKRFGINKLINKENAKLMLQSLSAFVRLCGYQGLLILFDEAESSYSVLKKSQLKDAHNNLLHLINTIESIPGLFLLYATTPDFYTDPKHGIITYGALSSRIGKPEDCPPRALDVVWNLDAIPVGLEVYQLVAQKILKIYKDAYPQYINNLPTETKVEEFVDQLFRNHPSLSPVRFWRVLTKALIAHFDDHLEGDIRPAEKLYDDIMDKLREE
ncbi:MAG: BREX system ATP-binding domain-containing protein [Bacillota bacterium]